MLVGRCLMLTGMPLFAMVIRIPLTSILILVGEALLMVIFISTTSRQVETISTLLRNLSLIYILTLRFILTLFIVVGK